jgi:1,5-anhydro-D-fructose reductase (1,5-anhydro-D-mannitol-forming)
VKVAALGFWHVHGNDYARDAVAHAGVDLVAVWDDVPERARAAEQTHNVPSRSLDEILDDPDIDGVIICSTTADHLDLAVKSAQAGKHIFIEKVLAATVSDAERIIDAVNQAGVTLVVSMRRSDKGFIRQVSELVRQGAIGTVTAMHVQDGHPFALPSAGHPSGRLPASFYDKESGQGGALIDLCHPIYLIAQVLGIPDHVSAQMGFVTGRPVEDNAAVLMRFTDGAIATAVSSYVTRSNPFVLEVHGTLGSILYSEPGIGVMVHDHQFPRAQSADSVEDVPTLRMWSLEDGPTTWRELVIEPDAPAAFDQWVALSESKTQASDNVELALALTRIVESAYASADESHHQTGTTQAAS